MVDQDQQKPIGLDASERVGQLGRKRRLGPPLLRFRLVDRPLIMRSLIAAGVGRMTLMVAPAGFGKTTALVQWHTQLKESGVAAAWYTASEADRDPCSFMHFLLRALDQAGVDLGVNEFVNGAHVSAELILDAVLLALALHKGEVVIIIDDFDRVESAPISYFVKSLIETVSENTFIVLSARRRPGVALSALLAQGGLRTFETPELTFGREEIAELLCRPPADPIIDIVAERTQGWPVAVGLFRIWRENNNAKDAYFPTFFAKGSQEFAVFLTEQIISKLDIRSKRFLIDMSIFEEVETRLADSVLGSKDSSALLDDMSRGLPGLIAPSTTLVEGYVIHPLLRDYCYSRACTDTGRVGQMHRRASAWFESEERYADAVKHAKLVEDPEFFDEAIDRLRPLEIFIQFGLGEIQAILRHMTPHIVAKHPRIQLMAALAYLKSGFFSEAEAMLSSVGEGTSEFKIDPRGNHRQLGLEASALQLLFPIYMHGGRANIVKPLSTLKLAKNDPTICVWRENCLIVIQELRGELAASQKTISRTKALYESGRIRRFGEAQILSHEILLSLAKGDLRASTNLASNIHQLKRSAASLVAPVVAVGKIANAIIDYERRYLETAADQAEVGLTLLGDAETWQEPATIVYGCLADVAARRDGFDGLRRVAQQCSDRAKRTGMTAALDFSEALEVAMLLRLGVTQGLDGRMQNLKALQKSWSKGAPSSWREREMVAVASALWHLAGRLPKAALEEADALIREGTEASLRRTLIKGLIIKSMALDLDGKRDTALQILTNALHIALQDGWVAVFAEERERVRPLVRLVFEDNDVSSEIRRHADSILRAMNRDQRVRDGLNEREVEILSHLMEGASNKLIARRLGISDNTVKFHLKKVFAKLGVSSRKAAAALAQKRTNSASG